jgi:hypothetical protein
MPLLLLLLNVRFLVQAGSISAGYDLPFRKGLRIAGAMLILGLLALGV